MSASFFFYDLETTGVKAARDRIMQFAGQRTDLNLKAIGEPINIAVRLTPDILPQPDAVLISGISPLDNLAHGITEAEFSKIFNEEIAIPDTIFVGFNNLRFDDEFIRYSNYRNFYDAYAWHWRDSSSRWDLLDVVRMTRALRPDGINWPFNDESKPSNRLEYLTTSNKLKHVNAHDALSDALATIDVARLLKSHQPKLFDYLLNLRKKAQLADLIKDNDALVYTSSHYSSEFLHTTVVVLLTFDEQVGSTLVFDLRADAKQFINLSVEELTKLWEYDPDSPRPRLPVKTMKLNRCPAIAPISVLDKDSIKRLKLDMSVIETNRQLINEHKAEFASKLKKVAKELDAKREDRRKSEPRIPYSEERLYDKFLSNSDTALFAKAREQAKLKNNFEISFSDKRLNDIYELYRARNYPHSLTKAEQSSWQEHVRTKLFNGEDSAYARFKARIQELKSENTKNSSKAKLLDDLNNYGLAILNDYAAD